MKKWIAQTDIGNISEGDEDWTAIRDRVKSLGMKIDGKMISLPKGMEEYIQFKSASGDLGSGEIKVLSRVIGFKLGNKYVKLRVDEKTNDITVEVDEVSL